MNTRKWVTDEVIILLDEGHEISLDKDFIRYYSKKGDKYILIYPDGKVAYTASELTVKVNLFEVYMKEYHIRKKKNKFSLKLISSTTDKVSMGKGFKDNEERIRADRKKANDKIKRSLGLRNN